MEKPAISGDDHRPSRKGDRLCLILTCLVQLGWGSLIYGALLSALTGIGRR